MANTRWLSEEVCQLIDYVKKDEAIYNPRHMNYFCRPYVENFWKVLDVKLSKNPGSSLAKWTNLRISFRREYSIYLEEKVTPSWTFFDKMLFLSPFLRKKRPQIDGIEPQNIQEALEQINSLTKGNYKSYVESIEHCGGNGITNSIVNPSTESDRLNEDDDIIWENDSIKEESIIDDMQSTAGSANDLEQFEMEISSGDGGRKSVTERNLIRRHERASSEDDCRLTKRINLGDSRNSVEPPTSSELNVGGGTNYLAVRNLQLRNSSQNGTVSAENYSRNMFRRYLEQQQQQNQIQNSSPSQLVNSSSGISNDLLNTTQTNSWQTKIKDEPDLTRNSSDLQQQQDNCYCNKTNDPDVMFLMSLLPDIQSLTRRDKGKLKIEIQKVIQNFLYPD